MLRPAVAGGLALRMHGSTECYTLRFTCCLPKLKDLVHCVVQASTSVKHLVLPCHWTQRSTIVADMIKSHGCAGRSIVFTDTKKDANELTASLSENCGAMALHGDIPQVGFNLFVCSRNTMLFSASWVMLYKCHTGTQSTISWCYHL